MRFLDLTLPDLADNLALDEALLLEAEAGGPELLRVWTWPRPAVVLGAGGKVADDVDEPACAAADVPLARRSSGGGTVLLGPGCLLYSLVLNYDRHPALRDVKGSYRYILAQMTEALVGLAPDIRHAGISDLASGDRKFSGNAQQRKRTHLLHHGTLLFAFDLALVGRFLKEPPRAPDYRARRHHEAFLMNISAQPQDLISRLRAQWQAADACTDWPHKRARELALDKYTREEWTKRR